MTTTTSRQPRRKRAQQGKDEATFALFPLSVLKYQQPRESSGLKVEEKVFPSTRWDKHSKAWVDQNITLSTSTKLGLPIPRDEHFTIAFLYLSYKQNKLQEHKTTFIPNQLFNLTNPTAKRHGGKRYVELRESLARLRHTSITYVNAYYDPEKQRYREDFSHGIIQNYRLYEPEDKQIASLAQPQSWIRWDEEFLNMLRRGILFPLDVDTYFSLKLPIARRIYRVLNRHFPNDPHYEADLNNFACGFVGLSPSYHVGQIKQALNPSINELVDRNIIDPSSVRYVKVKRSVWRICFDQAAPERQPHERTKLQLELTRRGVTATVANRLINTHPADKIQFQLEHFDFLTNSHNHDNPNGGGWLADAIRNNWQPPKDFKTIAQMDAERLKANQRHQREQELDARRRAAEAAEIKRLDDHFDHLTPAEQRTTLAAAFANANTFNLTQYHKAQNAANPQDTELWRRTILHDHLCRTLTTSASSPTAANLQPAK